jgi:hypothetical protein
MDVLVEVTMVPTPSLDPPSTGPSTSSTLETAPPPKNNVTADEIIGKTHDQIIAAGAHAVSIAETKKKVMIAMANHRERTNLNIDMYQEMVLKVLDDRYKTIAHFVGTAKKIIDQVTETEGDPTAETEDTHAHRNKRLCKGIVTELRPIVARLVGMPGVTMHAGLPSAIGHGSILPNRPNESVLSQKNCTFSSDSQFVALTGLGRVTETGFVINSKAVELNVKPIAASVFCLGTGDIYFNVHNSPKIHCYARGQMRVVRDGVLKHMTGNGSAVVAHPMGILEYWMDIKNTTDKPRIVRISFNDTTRCLFVGNDVSPGCRFLDPNEFTITTSDFVENADKRIEANLFVRHKEASLFIVMKNKKSVIYTLVTDLGMHGAVLSSDGQWIVLSKNERDICISETRLIYDGVKFKETPTPVRTYSLLPGDTMTRIGISANQSQIFVTTSKNFLYLI